jgi:UDP-N-acetyl-D-mannosaminuronic acid transferase (WecB/TagA/CpsF family)
MEPLAGSESCSLLGIRVDIATPAHAALAIWDSATSRSGLRVILADLWTLLFAQRDYSVWEALSSADYVLLAGNATILRRLLRRRDVPILQPEPLLTDLLDAATRGGKSVALVAPPQELSVDLALLRQTWPTLQSDGFSKATATSLATKDHVLLRAVNDMHPDILVLGGDSPWQERWMHEHRGMLDVGVMILFPSLQSALAAGAQCAGMPAPGLGRLRRQATLQRAMATTIGPMATASAATVGSWLQEARDELSGWSAALQARRTPTALRRLGTPGRPYSSHAGIRVAELPGPAEIDLARRLGGSPLARLRPPSHFPALPPADRRSLIAEQPTIALPLNALRASIPQVVSSYLIETVEPSKSEASENAALVARSDQAAYDQENDQEDGSTALVPPEAPTTLLPAPVDGAAEAASATTPADPGPTQRLPNRVPASNFDELPPTRRLQRPAVLPPQVPAADAPASVPATTPPEEAAPVPSQTSDPFAPVGDTPPIPLSGAEVAQGSHRAHGGQSALSPATRSARARRLAWAKRPRRQLARRRRRPSRLA